MSRRETTEQVGHSGHDLDSALYQVLLPEIMLQDAGMPETLDRLTAFKVTVEANQGQDIWAGKWSRTIILPTAKGSAAPEVAWAWHSLAGDVRRWVEDSQRNMAVPDPMHDEWPAWLRTCAFDVFTEWLDKAPAGTEASVLADLGYRFDFTDQRTLRRAIHRSNIPEYLLAGKLVLDDLIPGVPAIPQPLALYLLLAKQSDKDKDRIGFFELLEIKRYVSLRETP